jgi:hypothetical protein
MSDETKALTQIQQDADGASLPDGTLLFDEIISAALMVPMSVTGPSDPNCIWGLPVAFWGKSGIAKSDKIRQGAARVGLECRVIYPGQKQPEDFSELPVVIDNQLRSACMLGQVNELNAIGRGVLVVDEASCATPATQGSMLGMVLERTVGATQIGPAIRMLLAGNYPKFAAGGYGLEAPFANRMAHIAIQCPSVDAWTNWLITEAAVKVESIEGPTAKLQAAWPDTWSLVRGWLAGFMRSNSSVLHQQPEPNNAQSSYCWASPRSWYMGGRSVATIRGLDMNRELEQLFMEACVGEGPAQEWCSWIANADLPDAREVLNKGWKIDKNRLDRVMAVYSSITALVTSVPEQKEKYDLATQAWGRLHELIKVGISDIALKHATALVENGLGSTSPGVPATLKKAAEPVVYEMGKSGLVKYL